MKEKRDIREIESKWQKYWQDKQTFFTDLLIKNKPKKYVLAMFPYPSGSGLHIGHIRTYTIADAMARFYRMKGYNVFFPMGWDAFGLPAEQYAIQTGHHPASFTDQNIFRFKSQLSKLNFSFDWNKEIKTSDPKYYRWIQWIFKQMYLQGLAEYKNVPVQWCEKLGTVLADEEVKTIEGQKVSERGSYPVVQKNIHQWVLKITNYAQELLEDLEDLDWPKSIKKLQTDWIGINQGTYIDFKVEKQKSTITIFTKSPHTIYGVTALALSVAHPLLNELIEVNKKTEIEEFCDYWRERKSEEIHGLFTGSYCFHPLTDAKIPIWVVNFVVSEFGTGAVMINAFTEEIFNYKEITNLLSEKELRQNKKIDYYFVKKYNLLQKKIFQISQAEKKVFGCLINSPLINNLGEKEKAIEIINNYLEKSGRGKKGKFFHLKDWIFSRQRYWGEPIPIIHRENDQMEPVDDQELPLILPELQDFAPDPKYYSPLQKAQEWINVKKGDLRGKRDINVMPQWAGSCWYHIGYLLKQTEDYLPLNSENAKKIINQWLPVDLYIGGQEHAVLHLLYARFWHKFLHKIGIIETPEPFNKLFCQGMIVGTDGEKMSKSKGNVINPDEIIEEYGSDALRLAIAFLAPPEKTTSFKLETVKAMKKWLKRVYNFFNFYKEKFILSNQTSDLELADGYQNMVFRGTKFYQEIKLNLIPPLLMSFINKCYQAKQIPNVYLKHFLQILNPLAPHSAKEIWENHFIENFSEDTWPSIEENNLFSKNSLIDILVQINGKKCEIIKAKLNENKDDLVERAQNNEKVSKAIQFKKILKLIWIENKLINFVID